MGKSFRPWDVDQQWLLPPSVSEFVPEGHVAHFVRNLVREELEPLIDQVRDNTGSFPQLRMPGTALRRTSRRLKTGESTAMSRRVGKNTERHALPATHQARPGLSRKP